MIIRIGAFYFSYFSLVGVFVIYMPRVLEIVGYSATEIGIIFAMAPLMRFLTPFVFLKHLKLSTNIYNLALLLSFLASILMFFFLENFILLLISIIILGISMSLTLPHVEMVALTLLNKEKYGKIRLWGSIGFIIIALNLDDYLDDPINALYFLMVTTLATLIVSYNIRIKDKNLEPLDTDDNFSLTKYWALWLSLFLMQVAFSPFYNFFTNYENSHGVSLETISYLWTLGIIFEIIIFRTQRPLLNLNLINVLKFTTFVTIIRWYIVYAFPDNLYLLYFSQSLHALSYALYYSASIALLHQLYSNKKLAQQFSLGIAYGLGGFVGALISGYIYEYFTEYLYLYASILTLIAFGFLFLHHKEVK